MVAATLKEALDGLQNSFVITDENVFRFWGAEIGDLPVHVVAAGERSKSLTVYDGCLQWLASQRATRSSTVVALGGGVIGDLAGFVAATYMRGIGLLQIPTSLLAMVDSSVGGKVGLDLEAGKNLVGAFFPPDHVALCMETLATLPVREFNNGAAEVWKYGAIMDEALFETLEARPLGPGDERLPEIVVRSVDLKRQVVEDDEFETSGRRASLNFGHTVGHALEVVTGYGPLLHGEAVSIGMVVEAAIGERLQMTDGGTSQRIARGLASQHLPVRVPGVDLATVVDAMRLDKKATAGNLALALLDGFGSSRLVSDVPESVVLECLRENL
jgi:3-dehydroquinate synthase